MLFHKIIYLVTKTIKKTVINIDMSLEDISKITEITSNN